MGTNNLSTRSDGSTIFSDDVNQYKTAMTQDLVPRNSSGVPTDDAGGLGSTLYRWSTSYIKKLVFGTVANSVSLEESSSNVVKLNFGSTSYLQLSSDGIVVYYSGNKVFEATASELAWYISGTKKFSVVTGGINRAYFGSVNYAISSTSTGSFSTTSASFTDITNATVSITTNGRPVKIFCISDNGGSASGFAINGTSNLNLASVIKLLRDSTEAGRYNLTFYDNTTDSKYLEVPASAVSFLDTPSAGTYTYKLQALTVVSTFRANNVKIVAMEL